MRGNISIRMAHPQLFLIKRAEPASGGNTRASIRVQQILTTGAMAGTKAPFMMVGEEATVTGGQTGSPPSTLPMEGAQTGEGSEVEPKDTENAKGQASEQSGDNTQGDTGIPKEGTGQLPEAPPGLEQGDAESGTGEAHEGPQEENGNTHKPASDEPGDDDDTGAQVANAGTVTVEVQTRRRERQGGERSPGQELR